MNLDVYVAVILFVQVIGGKLNDQYYIFQNSPLIWFPRGETPGQDTNDIYPGYNANSPPYTSSNNKTRLTLSGRSTTSTSSTSKNQEEEQKLNDLSVSDVDDVRGVPAQESRSKRSVINLYNMIECSSQCHPLSYLGYGCFCGISGVGRPLDAIDRCCEIHDRCYTASCGRGFSLYAAPYQWTCFHNTPLCAISFGIYGSQEWCAQQICECDRQFAECVRRFPCPTRRKTVCPSFHPLRRLQNFARNILFWKPR